MKLFKANLVEDLSCFVYETHADAGDLKVWMESFFGEKIDCINFKGEEAIFYLNGYYSVVVKQGEIVVQLNKRVEVLSEIDFELIFCKVAYPAAPA